MANYNELARKMEERAVVKEICGDYIIYRRDWLREHIEQEYVLQKSVKDFMPIKDGITRLREWMKNQEKG